jgi:hypothetical protein
MIVPEWRTGIHLSIRTAAGWQEVPGDLLMVGDREAISVHRIPGGWSLNHHDSGARICGLRGLEECHRVAEALARVVPPEVWGAEGDAEPAEDLPLPRVASALAPYVWPIIEGRCAWIRGRWIDQVRAPGVTP